MSQSKIKVKFDIDCTDEAPQEGGCRKKSNDIINLRSKAERCFSSAHREVKNFENDLSYNKIRLIKKLLKLSKNSRSTVDDMKNLLDKKTEELKDYKLSALRNCK